jgi:hypothetical protein
VHHRALSEGGFDLTAWDAVLWIAGDQSTDDRTFTPKEQALLRTYLDNGGHLVVSGSEVAWDLSAKGSGPDFLTRSARAISPISAAAIRWSGPDLSTRSAR